MLAGAMPASTSQGTILPTCIGCVLVLTNFLALMDLDPSDYETEIKKKKIARGANTPCVDSQYMNDYMANIYLRRWKQNQDILYLIHLA